MKEQKEEIVKCVDFTFDGQGLAKNKQNKVFFVPSLLIGEEAKIEILYHKKDYDIGKIKELITKSPYRINPKCKCATSCGGCSFQNLDYKKELKYKKDLALKTIKNLSGMTFNKSKIYGMKDPYYYRNKIQIPFGKDKQNRLVYGFYKFKSHAIVPIEECVIEDKVHINILKTIKTLMLKYKIEPYNEDKETGILRHCLIRVGKVSKEVMVTLIVKDDKFKNKNNFSKELTKLCPEITTLILNINPRKTNVILGEKEIVLYGKGYIYDFLMNIKFKISSKSFYQVNHDQCEVLYNLALEKAKLTKEDTILDAYCGIGTIGLSASQKVKKVVGFEIISDAIKDAKVNAKLNNITNAYFYCKDASNFEFKDEFNVVFVDPPRKGLDEKFINLLLEKNITKIIYISCDVGTFARDIKILSKKYDIETVDFVDMFPKTYHIETVGLLTLK